eukprot:CAMPEP_0204368826 /NCGR_PEP_ID=MMETSP0469-20131031/44495_1 /ASSEMBLY_ACC=CAM_ASM_000384 /TAXON_ID=2969 /ORGANISM="Oxyrrhis marina" /LENGTH=398 /DNA_ID=CAMNT_0051358449 /DNA_START=1 /DNA_END=1198 /DNA_ORIENTATION=+
MSSSRGRRPAGIAAGLRVRARSARSSPEEASETPTSVRPTSREDDRQTDGWLGAPLDSEQHQHFARQISCVCEDLQGGMKLFCTASFWFARFFKGAQLGAFEPRIVAVACVWLANKVVERALRLRDIVNGFRSVNAESIEMGMEEYWKLRDEVLRVEACVCRQLRFRLDPYHGSAYLMLLLAAWEASPSDAHNALGAMHDFLCTPACADVVPERTAVAALLVAVELGSAEKGLRHSLKVDAAAEHLGVVVRNFGGWDSVSELAVQMREVVRRAQLADLDGGRTGASDLGGSGQPLRTPHNSTFVAEGAHAGGWRETDSENEARDGGADSFGSGPIATRSDLSESLSDARKLIVSGWLTAGAILRGRTAQAALALSLQQSASRKARVAGRAQQRLPPAV